MHSSDYSVFLKYPGLVRVTPVPWCSGPSYGTLDAMTLVRIREGLPKPKAYLLLIPKVLKRISKFFNFPSANLVNFF